MKIKTLLSALLIFVTISVFGQTSKQLIDASKAKTEKLQEALNLTSDQNELVYRQVYAYESELQRFNSLETKTAANKKALENYAQNYDASMKKILNTDQYTEFSKLMKKEKKTFLQ